MNIFGSLLLRANGDDFDASWVNSITTALKSFFGSGVTSFTPFTIANNQTTLQDITDMECDETSFKYYKFRYDMHREDDGPTNQDEVGYLEAFYNGSTWECIRTITFGNSLGDGSDGGVGTGTDYLLINSSGQGQYKSSNFAGGSYSGSLSWAIVETRLEVS